MKVNKIRSRIFYLKSLFMLYASGIIIQIIINLDAL
ncbi:hypothetical protein KSF78_0007786 [Schistosoma japonicum]|nr:hypothetical protein KSF78_0007786 [Schistosoma japonicum]KAH8862329.1 hypothetical protein KSF78_0007786 [Schistosoma japonicum]